METLREYTPEEIDKILDLVDMFAMFSQPWEKKLPNS